MEIKELSEPKGVNRVVANVHFWASRGMEQRWMLLHIDDHGRVCSALKKEFADRHTQEVDLTATPITTTVTQP